MPIPLTASMGIDSTDYHNRFHIVSGLHRLQAYMNPYTLLLPINSCRLTPERDVSVPASCQVQSLQLLQQHHCPQLMPPVQHDRLQMAQYYRHLRIPLRSDMVYDTIKAIIVPRIPVCCHICVTGSVCSSAAPAVYRDILRPVKHLHLGVLLPNRIESYTHQSLLTSEDIVVVSTEVDEHKLVMLTDIKFDLRKVRNVRAAKGLSLSHSWRQARLNWPLSSPTTLGDMRMEQCRNAYVGGGGDTRENPPAAASSGAIPTCENLGGTPPGIEPGSPGWDATLSVAYCIWQRALPLYRTRAELGTATVSGVYLNRCGDVRRWKASRGHGRCSNVVAAAAAVRVAGEGVQLGRRPSPGVAPRDTALRPRGHLLQPQRRQLQVLLCRGDVTVTPLASHLGEPGSIPRGAAFGLPHVSDGSACGRVFSRFSRFHNPLHSNAAPSSPRTTLIGTQCLEVKNCPKPLYYPQSSVTCCPYLPQQNVGDMKVGAVVAQWLDYSPSATTNRTRFPARSIRIFVSGKRGRLGYGHCFIYPSCQRSVLGYAPSSLWRFAMQMIDVKCPRYVILAVNDFFAQLVRGSVEDEGDEKRPHLQHTARERAEFSSAKQAMGFTCSEVLGRGNGHSCIGRPSSMHAACIQHAQTIFFTWFSTKANRVQSLARKPDFLKWESCRTMPLVGGFSRGSTVPLAHSFRCHSIFTSITLIGSQDLAVKSRSNIFAHPYHFVSTIDSCGADLMSSWITMCNRFSDESGSSDPGFPLKTAGSATEKRTFEVELLAAGSLKLLKAWMRGMTSSSASLNLGVVGSYN
ncbi:hypothetical protein PR048_018567 [Dryococelus australis]|uniref:Uncharacterized protein n=1 Tax=Dryococelus australis TaxID=614101 RepID=A0ABQ9HCT8_9NEOP|nr:hypothetical protein PR048_018567 [Dryococelus australis]